MWVILGAAARAVYALVRWLLSPRPIVVSVRLDHAETSSGWTVLHVERRWSNGEADMKLIALVCPFAPFIYLDSQPAQRKKSNVCRK
jgi:hypothetical protein